MTKKKTISKDKILTFYMDYVLKHNETPKSVHNFSKSYDFDEAKFYEHYGSFKAIEKHVFMAFFMNTKNVLDKSEEYKMFDARNQLLSFYFTFFENLTANRSYVLFALNKEKNSLKNISTLSELRKLFTGYVNELDIETIDAKHEYLDKIQKNALQETAWMQLLLTIKFWMNDSSRSFEKTDIFIEKSVNTSFDLLNITPLKSVIDFGKFLFKEKMNMA